MKGRGTEANPANRFDGMGRSPEADDWWQADDLPPPATTLTLETARSILTRNASPDIPFDRSINPYQGCEHGCIYCYARPSHAHFGLSPGLDFETRLFGKRDAARLLEQELGKRGYRPQTIVLGANTDPYQPVERQTGITRSILEVLARCRHPVAIITKSALVLRDLDLLVGMAAAGLVRVGLSVTTLDAGLARRMEPRATTPGKRLRTIASLAATGVPVTVMAAPMIPFLNDHELEGILTAAAKAGASGAGYTLIRLPHELKALFADWLLAHYPDRARRVDQAIRSCHDGRLYRADWRTRMRGDGPYAALLAQRFAIACRRLGLMHGSGAARPLAAHLFRPPCPAGDQLDLALPGGGATPQ